MFKRSITYTDFNDKEVTEELYFNLSKTELISMEVSMEGGLGEYLQRIVKEQNPQILVEQFKWLILQCYGEKSEDGKRFEKSDAIREAFTHTAAFDQLFWELATNADAGGDFVNGVMPKNLVEDAKALAQDAPPSPLLNPPKPPPFTLPPSQ